jgi:hypothetical protein
LIIEADVIGIVESSRMKAGSGKRHKAMAITRLSSDEEALCAIIAQVYQRLAQSKHEGKLAHVGHILPRQ